MPHQDPPSKHLSPPGFVQRTFTYFARGDVQHFQFLLPLCGLPPVSRTHPMT